MNITARKISAQIRGAEQRGFNVYMKTGEWTTVRVIKARTYKGQVQIYCLPAGEWLDYHGNVLDAR